MKDETEPQENGLTSRKTRKKKAHRGYAFIVYEREKDMKGIVFLDPTSKIAFG